MGRIGTACPARATRYCAGSALRGRAVGALAWAVTALRRGAVDRRACAVIALRRRAGGQAGGGGVGGRVLDAAWR